MNLLKMMMPRRFYWLLVLALSWAGPGFASPVTVTTAWLADHRDDPGLVLVDMTAGPVQYRRLFRALGELGINADSHVVIYDDMGGLEAGRLFWELERIGHAHASVLDGGPVAWILDGRPVAAEVPPAVRVHYRPAARDVATTSTSPVSLPRGKIHPSFWFLDGRLSEFKRNKGTDIPARRGR